MFLADMANQEWEVEISPSSRYYTQGELVGGESRRRSTRPRADLWGPSDRSNPSFGTTSDRCRFAFRSSTPFSEFRSENLRDGPGRTLIDYRARARGDSEIWPSIHWARPCDSSTACSPRGWSRGSPTRNCLSVSSPRGMPGPSKRWWGGTDRWS